MQHRINDIWKGLGKRKKVGLAALILATIIWGASARPYRPVQPLPGDIIDMHCHAAGLGYGNSGCFVSKKLRDNWRFRVYLKSFGVTEKELKEKGDQLLVDRISKKLSESTCVHKAVLLAMDGVVGADGKLDFQHTEFYVPNTFVADAVAHHTNLLFGASINPYRKDALEQLTWAKEHGAVLVKWLPPIMKIDPSDPALIPFYKKLVELDLPLLCHTGNEHSFSTAERELCDPERLRLPLSVGVRVIAAHLGSNGRFCGESGIKRLARLMTEYPNLYTDISSLTQINKLGCMKKALLWPEFQDRLVYGTDYPLINTALVSPVYSFFRLPPWKMIMLLRVNNTWDADVKLKQELGTPASVFSRFGNLKPTGM